jgi:protein-disulfide isomerase
MIGIVTSRGAALLVLVALGQGGCRHEELVAGPEDRVVIDVGDAPSRGAEDAPVTIVEFADYECPYCADEESVVLRLLAAYDGRVRLVFKQFPIPYHAYATLAAEASLAASAQGQFWAYHDALFAYQGALSRENLEAYAALLGLDLTAFNAALDEHTYADAVQADVDQGIALGVGGTPTFFVNGRKGAGALSYETLAQVVEEELRLAGAE